MASSLPATLDVPLFPLSGVVLLPHAVLPLRIFEPRYLAMLKDAMAHDKLIGIAQVRPASFVSTAGVEPMPPAVFNVIGVGKIVAHRELDDGTSHIALLGQARCKIGSEISHEPYRVARVLTLKDELPGEMDARRDFKRQHAEVEAFARKLIARTMDSLAAARFYEALDEQCEAGTLSDLLAGIFVQDCMLKQFLLESTGVLSRLRVLLAVLKKQLQAAQSRPLPMRYDYDEIYLN